MVIFPFALRPVFGKLSENKQEPPLRVNHDFWEMLDGVLVINMDASTGRMERFRALHEGVIPPEKLHRISAVVGRELPGYGVPPWFTENTGERSRFWGGTAGCALSHRKAIEYARERAWRNVLILEDDVRLVPDTESLCLAARALQKLQGRYMLYLGYNRPNPCGFKVLKGEGCDVWRVSGVLATHAYIVPAASYDLILGILPTEENVWEWLSVYKAVDVMYREYVAVQPGVKIYALYPMVGKQSDEFSEIGQNSADGEAMSCSRPPDGAYSLRCFLRFVCPWIGRWKSRLNSIRTHRRALRGGLPGYRKKKK